MDAEKQRGNSAKTVVGRPFKKGESGNPNGRPPKRLCLTNMLEDELRRLSPIDDNGEKRTWAELVARALVRQAVKGDMAAIRELLDRLDGKPKQASSLEVSGPGGEPLTLTTERARAAILDAVQRIRSADDAIGAE